MLEKKGEKALFKFGENSYQYKIYKINDRIYHVVGLGHSNAIVIEGKNSLILVDTLDSDARSARMMAEIRKWTDKSVETIIYTHGHPDHRGGAGTFRDTVKEIIAFSARKPVLKYYEKLNEILALRTKRQFGYGLTDEETINQGIGIREGIAVQDGGYDFLPPTRIYSSENVVDCEIDGVKLRLVSAIGEMDDELFVWLPDDKVLCCGDNYYGCWPNLYAIRGSQYRDIATWVDSLENMISYPTEALLPGHTKPIIGADEVKETLSNYKEAIQSILFQSLNCMNRGMNISEAIAQIQLPYNLKILPYLGEFYGTINWTVRSIYNGYFGWFDGNPTNLNPLSDDKYAHEILHLIGGESKVLKRIQECLSTEEYQTAIQLCDLLMNTGNQNQKIKSLKADGLLGLSKECSSANERHYYIAYAKELEE